MNAMDVLKYGHLTLLRSLDGFPDQAWETSGACGSWSVKAIVSHLASYERVLEDVLQGFVSKGETPYLAKFTMQNADFNDSEVAARKEKSVQEVLYEYNQVHGNVMSLAAKIQPGTFSQVGTLPWYGQEYALDDYLVYAFYGHKREHSAQIDAFRDRIFQYPQVDRTERSIRTKP
jgi:Mycothiol maleylpyruvate isomerase N-terminal domain